MKNKKRILKALSLAVMAVCLLPIGRAHSQSVRNRAQQESLKEMKSEMKSEIAPETAAASETTGRSAPTAAAASTLTVPVKTDNEKPDTPDTVEYAGQTEKKPDILDKYAALHKENNDLAGWLAIDGMKIDYPVMQCEDDEYYLHHDFYGKDSGYGCLFVKERADLDAGTNFIIYGHNMKDGSMFGDLDLYLKESFYKEHPAVSFDTLYEERSYDIIAVFRSQVYNADDDVFKYYQFYEAETQEEFDDFYSNIKKLSIYDTGVEAQFGDTFLTLSTCAYHVKDGRLVVVAKRTE